MDHDTRTRTSTSARRESGNRESARPGTRRSRFARPGAAFRFFFIIAVILTAASLGFLRYRLEFPWLLAYLAAINVVMFIAYLYDKIAAGRTWVRVPERLLHFIAAAGGSPAALAAQMLLRHKTIKRSFRVWFWGIAITQLVLIGLCCFYYIHSVSRG